MTGYIMVGIGGIVLAFITFTLWAANSRWAGERDWVYNRYNPRKRGGGTLGMLEEIFQPSIEYVIEERSAERARGSQDESGEKPDAGRIAPGRDRP